ASGSKRVGAIQTKVTTTDRGVAIPNVGLYIGGDPNAATPQKPPAMCADAGGFALSKIVTNQFGDQSAVISCDLIATAAPGNYQYWVYVGGTTRYFGPYNLTITAGSPANVTIVSGNN